MINATLFPGLSDVNIAAVWRDLGGPPIVRSRAPAFWRGSKDPNVAINVERGVWHDHAQNKGGGVLALVQTALSCTKRDALVWLEERGYIPRRTFSAPQQRRFARATAAAPDLAQEIGDWACGLEQWAERQKADLIEAAEFFLDAGCEAVADRLYEEILTLRPALRIREMAPADIAAAFAELRRENPHAIDRFLRLGREDRADAEAITAKVVRLLATAQEAGSLPV